MSTHDPASPSPGLYPREIRAMSLKRHGRECAEQLIRISNRNISDTRQQEKKKQTMCKRMFTAAFLTISPEGKFSKIHPSRMDSLWYVYTEEIYTASQVNHAQLHAASWKDLPRVRVSMSAYCRIPSVNGSKQAN